MWWHRQICGAAVEAGHAESDRRVRSILSARRSEEDLSAVRTYAHQSREQHDIGIEPVTPQEPAEAARLIPQQVCSQCTSLAYCAPAQQSADAIPNLFQRLRTECA